MDLKALQDRTVKVLQNTPNSSYNFEWCCMDNLFPEEDYERFRTQSLQQTSQDMLDIFDNEEFVKTLFEKFSNSKLRSDVISSIYTFHQVSGAGYSLKPHCDSYPRVFTMVVYLADDNDYPEYGTAIYSVDRAARTYETVDMSPFVRNSAMIFPPYDNETWHGVNMNEQPLERKSIVVVFSAEEWNENQLHYAEWKPGRTVKYHG